MVRSANYNIAYKRKRRWTRGLLTFALVPRSHNHDYWLPPRLLVVDVHSRLSMGGWLLRKRISETVESENHAMGHYV